MKTLEIVTLRTFQALTVLLGAIVFVAIAFAIVQIATGNIQSTSAREF